MAFGLNAPLAPSELSSRRKIRRLRLVTQTLILSEVATQNRRGPFSCGIDQGQLCALINVFFSQGCADMNLEFVKS